MKVKIIGAGSIGNHLAQAARRMGWDVVIVDADPKALERTKNYIYPKRYDAWDSAIQLFQAGSDPKGGFDIIMIGTPPDSHMKLALMALKEGPRLLHIEKPLCTPDLSGIDDLMRTIDVNPDTIVTVGYDHAVSSGIEYVVSLLERKIIGEALAIDVEFREHWEGIFKAHPWLTGPQDSYLGFWKRGGGAGCEHSHALHLWLYLAKISGWIVDASKVQSAMDICQDKGVAYDRIAAFLLSSQSGKVGRVIQDVITLPTKKWLRVQGDKGFIEWHCNGAANGDLVMYNIYGSPAEQRVFAKTRPDDFYREMLHYQKLLSGELPVSCSPLSLESGLAVMNILQKAYRSNADNRL